MLSASEAYIPRDDPGAFQSQRRYRILSRSFGDQWSSESISDGNCSRAVPEQGTVLWAYSSRAMRSLDDWVPIRGGIGSEGSA